MNKTLIIQVFVIGSIVLGYFFIDFNAVYNSFRGEIQFSLQDKNCDLHKGPCEVTIKDGTKLTLEVFPKNIPLMEELKFKLKSTNENHKDLQIRLYATNMLMGFFDLKFKNLGNGEYEANGKLPTCPVGDMHWDADVEVGKLNERIGAKFQFQTAR